MFLRRMLGVSLALSLSLSVALPARAQDDDTSHRRGRKYKAPPETAYLEVLVVKNFNGKPIPNAAVVFHPTMNYQDEGNLEVKTDPEGKAIIDVIPKGSTVTVQVIADGFATHAEEFVLNDAKSIVVKMLRPQAQISTYQDNRGKLADRPAGVQERVPATTPPVVQTPQPTDHTSDPNPIAPVAPNPPLN